MFVLLLPCYSGAPRSCELQYSNVSLLNSVVFVVVVQNFHTSN